MQALCFRRTISAHVNHFQFTRSYASAHPPPSSHAEIRKILSKFDLAMKDAKRFNSVGIQQIGHHLHSQLFPNKPTPHISNELIHLSQEHLLQHNLLGKNSASVEEISFDLPPLVGNNLEEHFYKLGQETAHPYLAMSKWFAEQVDLPEKPLQWAATSGWTRYSKDGSRSAVDFPSEDCICFDVEVLYKESPYAIMACAASDTAWYCWLSPWLLGESESSKHLVPLGGQQDRLVVGHNVGYDRSKVEEEYDLKKSRLAFIDTMSLHVAANGMCSRQRPTWMKNKRHKELREKILSEANAPDLAKLLETLAEDEVEDLWISKSSTNSLLEVAQFHCNIKPEKGLRDAFGVYDRATVVENLQSLVSYCADDVLITHLVFKKVFPSYLAIAPHPVSLAALFQMNAMYLTVDRTWDDYIKAAETTYLNRSEEVKLRLAEMAESLLVYKDSPELIAQDPWLRQLDWTCKPERMVRNKSDGVERPAKNQKMPGLPNWYRDMFSRAGGTLNITVRSRIAPILLRMNWDGCPLVWTDKYGWVVQVAKQDAVHIFRQKRFLECDMSDELDQSLRSDEAAYFKLPHKDGPSARVASPFSKAYVAAFEDGSLSSEFPLAKQALEMNASCSYWISARDRIISQMVVWSDERQSTRGDENHGVVGVILPQTVPMGTVTRRAIEPTWMTASNAKTNRVGSELKSMIKAPAGYVFVGADVDSEELWIASLMGDAQFGMHGSTALGWMTLEGTKAQGTDLHSKTAEILGISRNDAKVFNYGRIYGAGLKFAVQLLLRFNPTLSEREARNTAEALYASTKGIKSKARHISPNSFWHGGTESYVFNKLEEMAEQDVPSTPVLGCGITQALLARFLSPGGFLTSRVNWAIQSSGVDYLHLLVVSMKYLIGYFDIDARLAITVHDEVRYMVKEEHATIAAYCLQVANLWTRAMFSEQMGIHDLPQSCAFFSEVDIDYVLRKESQMDCVTPSNPVAIQPGESIDISTILSRSQAQLEGRPLYPLPSDRWKFVQRPTVAGCPRVNSDFAYLKAQSLYHLPEVDEHPDSRKRPVRDFSSNHPEQLGDSRTENTRRRASEQVHRTCVDSYRARTRTNKPPAMRL